MPSNGGATRPASEETLTIVPDFCSRIWGRTVCVTRSAPKKFVSNISFASSTSVSSIGPLAPMPALFTSTSIRPSASITCFTAFETESPSVTSSWTT